MESQNTPRELNANNISSAEEVNGEIDTENKCHQPVVTSKQPTSSELPKPEHAQNFDDNKMENHPEEYIATSTSENAMHDISDPDVGNENSTDEATKEEVDSNSDTSDTNEFSDFSQESWHPVQGPIAWVQEQMRQGHSPRKILEDLVPAGTLIPNGLDPIMLWKIIINIVSEPPRRKKLDQVNTLDDVIHLLKTKKKIMVLTGAGVSVSCGIPDFRSRDGVYARLSVDFPNLPDPQAMFDIHFFRNDPRPFFKFAKEIYPGQFHPSPCHKFIRMLETKGKLLRNYTQNIDTLEQVAGIEKVIQCHGSFATATCAVCGFKVNSDVIKDDIFKQVIPLCSRCHSDNERAVMKPDIVFFGESLPEDFHNQMAADKDDCDLLIVIGSSLKVRPVALIPNSLPAHVPQILINRERLHYLNFDVELLGNCDDIVGDLCRRLGEGWEELASPSPPLTEVDLASLPTPPVSPQHQDSDTSSPSAASSKETKMTSEIANNVQSTETSLKENDHHSDLKQCTDSSNAESTSDIPHQNQAVVCSATSSSSHCSSHCSSSTSNSDRTHKSCKKGSINCGITPHHTQDVMFCPSKGAPHSLSKHKIAKCGSDVSESSSCAHCHHHHHHSLHHHHDSEKRKLDSCDEEGEPSKKYPKLSTDEEHSDEPSAPAEAADKSAEYPDLDDSLDEVRKMWQSKRRISLAQRLSDDQVLFLPPCRYVFKGAEVFSDYDGEDSDDSSSGDSGESEDEDDKEENEDSGEATAKKDMTEDGEKQKEDSQTEERKKLDKETEEPDSTTSQLSVNSESLQPSTSVIESQQEGSSSSSSSSS